MRGGTKPDSPRGTSFCCRAGQWHHVGFTISDALRLYIDGKAAGEARDAVLPADSVTLGGRFKGEMDEAQVSGLVRTAEWIVVQAALEPDGKLVVMGEEESAQLQEAQKQNQELDLQRKQLEQDLKVKSASLAKEGGQRNLCETNNGELYRIGRELVDWYTSKGPLNAILEAEPFTGMKSVEMENLLENYREKLETRHLEPSVSREIREIHGYLLP